MMMINDDFTSTKTFRYQDTARQLLLTININNVVCYTR